MSHSLDLTVLSPNSIAIAAIQNHLVQLQAEANEGDAFTKDKADDKIRSLRTELNVRLVGRRLNWHDPAIEHAIGSAGIAYDDECIVALANGRTLRFPAHPASCRYIRVEHAGHELGYWVSDEFSADAENVLGAILGLAKGGGARYGFMYEPINNVDAGRRFLAALFANDLLYHLDDDPGSVINVHTDGLVFTEAELEQIRARRDELFQLPGFDPHDYCLALIGD